MIHEDVLNKDTTTAKWDDSTWMVFNQLIFILNKSEQDLKLHYKNNEARIGFMNKSGRRLNIAVIKYQPLLNRFKIRAGSIELFPSLFKIYGDFIVLKDDGAQLPIESILKINNYVDNIITNIDDVVNIIITSAIYYSEN